MEGGVEARALGTAVGTADGVRTAEVGGGRSSPCSECDAAVADATGPGGAEERERVRAVFLAVPVWVVGRRDSGGGGVASGVVEATATVSSAPEPGEKCAGVAPEVWRAVAGSK